MRRGRSKISAGLLLYRQSAGGLDVLLAHPGGPFFANRDEGIWTIPKGEPDETEADLLATARREFAEETGFAPEGPFASLGTIQQRGGKIVHAWACAGSLPPGHQHRCSSFQMEWPPDSGCFQAFPEIDEIRFFPIPEARRKLKEPQVLFLDRLLAQLAPQLPPPR